MNANWPMHYLNRKEWLILFALFGYSFIPVIISLLRLWELGGGPSVVPENPRALATPLPTVIHLVSIITYCYLGAFQFLNGIRRHAPNWHRLNGRIVVVAGAISALSGAWLTHYYTFPPDLQGVSLYYFRLIISLAMLLSLLLGVMAIIQKRIKDHRAWMIRAYAIALGASTQSFLGISWLLLLGAEVAGTQRDGLLIAAWLINLAVAELIIRKR